AGAGALVLQFVAQGNEPPPISLGIAVVDEVAIVLVRSTDAPRVPNRTPILLGQPRDITYVGKHAVGVPTEHAIELLDRIQVGEMLAINDHVPGPTDTRDAVDAKADGLIEADPDIKRRDRYDHRVNQRGGQKI